MRRILLLFILMLTLVGCGTQASSKPKSVSPSPTQQLQTFHPCVPSNYYMQCADNAPGQVHSLQGLKASNFGVDFAWGGPSCSTLKSHGARFGVSYLSWTTKDWSPGLLASYRNGGCGIGFVWETTAARALGGCAAGAADGRSAASELRSLGYSTAPVFFAVDFDTSGYSTFGVVHDYFRCAAANIGWSRSGVYGGLRTMQIALDTGAVKYGWQTLAWSYGRWDPRACLRQVSINNSWFGYGVDYNYALCANWGQWNPGPPPPPPDPHHYRWFPTGPFPSPWGKLNERLTVLQYDGARLQPVKYAGYLHKVLQPKLHYLAQRDFAVAHRRKPPTWNRFHRGWRFQQLAKRAKGQKIV